jgi:hypothetical protein
MDTENKESGDAGETPPVIAPETMIIDIISGYRQTEPVFRRLEEETGTCVLCQGLFLTLGEAAGQFGFDLKTVMGNLHDVVDGAD